MRVLFLSLFICIIAANATTNEEVSEKRANQDTCDFTEEDPYPAECSGGVGPKCIQDSPDSGDQGSCGCDVDKDCFSTVSRPYCVEHRCVRCDSVPTGEDENADHKFCKKRFPGYVTRPGTNHTLALEAVAPTNYFREVCNRDPNDGGACQRCSAAPIQPYPNMPNRKSVEGASGTFFCKQVHPNNPVCMDLTYFQDCGVEEAFDVNLRGACTSCLGKNALCARALPTTPVCHDGSCVGCSSNSVCDAAAGGVNCESDGSCKNCENNAGCRATDGGEVREQWICKAGLCSACSSNADCTADPDYGNNCAADGTCFACQNDDDCANDGGEVKGQTLCNAEEGICFTACTSNDMCTGEGKNCMAGGRCQSCTADADCGDLDGGEKAAQPQCDLVNGICVDRYDCNAEDEVPGGNEGCKAYGGGNCQKNGDCVKCTSNDMCGDNDGGKVPGQHYCDLKTGICERCSSNVHCADNKNGFYNCGSDGFCHSCNNEGCGAVDGPPDGPLNGQEHCDPETGMCVDSCTEDAHCMPADEQCTQDCLPKCLLRRACCVQCVSDDDCPLGAWRNEQLAYNRCSNSTFTCVKGCMTDADCLAPTLPACDARAGVCKACVNDGHCAGDTRCDAGLCVAIEYTHPDFSVGSIAALVIGCIALVTSCIAIILVFQKLRSHDHDQHLLS